MALQQEIESIAAQGGGTYGIAAKHLVTGERVDLRADEEFNTASVIKVPVMVELFHRVERGELSLDDRMELSDQHRTGGSGLLKEFASGARLTLRDLCLAMIAVSDNTATNMLADTLGIEEINHRMREFGLERTRLNRLIGFAPSDGGLRVELGVTTPDEMLRLYEALAKGEVVSPEASEQMIGILARQQYRDLIPRLLPLEYDAVAGTSEPRVASKTGAVDGVRNDVALLSFADGRRWIVSAFSKDLTDLRWSSENEGARTIALISRAIWDAWA